VPRTRSPGTPRAVFLLSAWASLGACASPPPPPAPVARPSPTPAAPPPAAAVEEQVPSLRLPADTHPLAEAIELRIDPRQDRFSGAVDIDVRLDRPRAVVWLHGKDLHVSAATITPEGGAPLAGTWEEREDSGIASIALSSVVPAGRARVRVAFDAPFGRGQKGLYKAGEAGVDYAFTQFEAIAARLAFPCFDEPAFKIPFTTTLVVPSDMTAIANTREVSRQQPSAEAPHARQRAEPNAEAPHARQRAEPNAGEGTDPSLAFTRISFAPTPPLPSYLVAFAVGPFDVVAAPDVPANGVRARALALRGVAPRGRGKEMAYALAHTGEILAVLEGYFGLEYPWDKLDILAVPGKGGAMENAGAITFSERLLLLDPTTAPVSQRRSYASVMAHELAHQWTGDLVTMAWWDDTWLNEAFATWMAAKAVQEWNPKLRQDIALLRGEQGAMSADSLASARSIRQPIVSTHDIENAFDSITYQKGGGVLAMFERYVGVERWRAGLHAYLAAHRFGNATADDFLDAESTAAGIDIKTPMRTFLDQPGVPYLELEPSRCQAASHSHDDAVDMAWVHVKQSRFLPIGSAASPNVTWQVPVCPRTAGGISCTLLTRPDGDIGLLPHSRRAAFRLTCPVDFFPNGEAAGYYRFALAPEDLARVRANLGTLSTRERIAYANGLRASYARATTSMKDAITAVEPLARDPEPAVAEEPMGYLAQADEWLFGDPLRARAQRYGRELYAPASRRLGWAPGKDEDDETRTLRGSVLWFLATTARDPSVRAEAKRRGRAYLGAAGDWTIHPEAVDANLASIAVDVVGEEADRATWDAMRALLAKSVDEAVRGRLVHALAVARDPQLAEAGRSLSLDPVLRDSEMLTPVFAQLSVPETREAAWAWMKEHYDAILARLPRHHAGVQLVSAGHFFCDEPHARDAEAFFGPKVDGIEGGPRVLAETLEDVRLCVAKRAAHERSARDFFAGRR
jgi:alanyl aminopeptidase